jgi:hypothetical protein
MCKGFIWRTFFGTVFVFHLAVVFEKGDIIGGGFNAQHATLFVVDFD